MINHQYYTLAANLYPRVIQGLQMANRIGPQEAQWLQGQVNSPAFDNFVHNLIAQVPSINGEQHLERLMLDNFIGPLIEQNRQNMAAMMSRGGGGGYGYGGRPMYGGGYYGGGCGYGAGGGSSWYAGNRMSTGGPRFASNPALRPRQQPQPQQTQVQKKEPPKPKIKWTEPKLVDGSLTKIEGNNNVSFAIQAFTAFDGAQDLEAFVIDDRPIYRSDAEAIAAYQNLFDGDTASRKFLTVCYRQLKTLHVDRTAFAALVKAVGIAIGNVSENDPAGRVRAIIGVAKDHPSGAVDALENLIVDEFNAHALCGELTDASKGHLDWKITISNLQGLYDMLTGSLPKQTRESLHQIKNFDEALKVVTSKVLNTVVGNGMVHKILNPVNDKTIMDIYGRAIPPAWRNNATGEWVVTENFFTKYLASKKTIDGSETDASRAAAQSLQNMIGLADKNYAVVQVSRIITWCNCSPDEIVYAMDDKYAPRVFSVESIDSDTSFFLNRAIARILKSKLTSYAAVPRKITCEVNETRVDIDYGITTDGGLWCGCLRYNY